MKSLWQIQLQFNRVTGEYLRIKYPREGYHSKAYIDYFEDGELVGTKLIRDEYYWPQLNYCGGEVDCGDAESGLREYSFAGHVDINDEAQTCACPTGTTAFLESGYYTRCCPNTIPIIWGHCLNEATLRSCSRERLYCSGDYPDFYSGIVNPTGGSDGYSCIDEVICCPHDLETGADGNKWCCPTGKTLTCNGEDCSCQ